MSLRVIAGRYRLDALIGQGAMGKVWRAHDDRLSRDVAVKVVEPDPATLQDGTAADRLERFRREATATARLDHPSIVSVFDAGTDGAMAYLVMELLRGSSVAELIRRQGTLPLPQALRIAADVASALSAAHAAGLVHRDIKPANVMVTDSRVTVLDFGIAHLHGADGTLTAPETTIGTAAYMAPEQASGGRVGPAADTYALGCLVMAMLTGTPPYVGDNAVAVATQQVSAPVMRLSSRVAVPVALDTLVASMLAKKPFDRPDASWAETQLRGILADPSPAMVGPAQVPAAPDATAFLLPQTGALPPTSVLPATATADPRPAATPLAPAATSVLPALPPPLHGSSRPTGYQTYQRNPMPGEHRGRWRLPVAIAVVLLLGLMAFLYAYESGRVLSAAHSATPRASGTSAAPVTRTTSAPPATSARPTSAAPSPGRPSVVTAVMRATAVRGVSAAVDRLDDSKAKSHLVTSWDTIAPQVLDQKSVAPKRVQDFADMVTGYQQSGDLTLPEALTILAAVEAVKLLL